MSFTDKKTIHVTGLAYDDQKKSTPEVVLQISGMQIAQAIAIAKKYGIPVKEDSSLAKSLKDLPQDSVIPEHLYRAVAVVLRQILGCRL